MTFAAGRLSFHGHATAVCAAGMFLALGAIAPAQAGEASDCARYGADYVAVSGSTGCVRIGGHVRAAKPASPALAYASTQQDGLFQTASNAPNLASFPPFRLLNEMLPR